jgi:hypothetical protein
VVEASPTVAIAAPPAAEAATPSEPNRAGTYAFDPSTGRRCRVLPNGALLPERRLSPWGADLPQRLSPVNKIRVQREPLHGVALSDVGGGSVYCVGANATLKVRPFISFPFAFLAQELETLNHPLGTERA